MAWCSDKINETCVKYVRANLTQPRLSVGLDGILEKGEHHGLRKVIREDAMKAPKEIKRWINRRRSREGKSNGVVRFLFEAPWVWVKLAKNKRLAQRPKAMDVNVNF
jgi:hypothetical protein